MATYICYGCGKAVNLLKPPSDTRICPHCGRKLRVCENCRYFDVSGCMLGKGEPPFSATHGNRCTHFDFRPAVLVQTST